MAEPDEQPDFSQAIVILHNGDDKENSETVNDRVMRLERRERAAKVEGPVEEEGHAAFKPLCGEPEEFALKRQTAFQDCWSDMKSKIDEELANTNRDAFDKLHRHMDEWHQKWVSASGRKEKYSQQLQAALIFAGGVNSADHAETFADLAKSLAEQGRHTALVRSRDLVGSGVRGAGGASGGQVNAVLRLVLQQVSGLPHALGQDTAALLAWYRGQQGPRRQQLVAVVVEDAECIDAHVLADLILVLSEVSGDMPVHLLLGMATSPAALQRLLPGDVAARLVPRRFELQPSVQRLEAVLERVMLAPQRTPLALTHECIRLLDRHFLVHDFSIGSWRRGLELALAHHFRSEPLSFLAPAAAGGGGQALEEAVSSLPRELLRKAAGRGGRDAAVEPAEVLTSLQLDLGQAAAGQDAWAGALRCLADAAAAVGGVPRSAGGVSLRELYRDASSPGYLVFPGGSPSRARFGGPGAGVVNHVASQMGDLGEQPFRNLLNRWADALAGRGALKEAYARVQGMVEKVFVQSPAPAARPAPAPATSAAAAPLTSAATGTSGEGGGGGAGADRAQGGLVRGLAGRAAGAVQPRHKAPRAALLRDFVEAAAGGEGRPGLSGSPAGAPPPRTLAHDAADLLRELCARHLAQPPECLPGRAVLVVGTGQGAGPGDWVPGWMAALEPAPRSAIEAALEHAKWGGGVEAEDACVAYALLNQMGELVNVAAWYVAFCHVLQPARAKKAAAAARSRKGKGASKKRRAAAAPPAASDVAGGATAAVAAAAAAAAEQEELQARFTRAAAELQLLGLLRPSKRRRGRLATPFVQRLVFPSGGGLSAGLGMEE